MTFKVQKVCAVCGAAESPRRRLVTIPEFLNTQPADFDKPIAPSSIYPERTNLDTYCLNRRCIVKAVFELALAKLREWNGR